MKEDFSQVYFMLFLLNSHAKGATEGLAVH